MSAINRVRELLRSVERPVLVHYSSANRIGSVWIPYRVLSDHIPLKDAVDEAKTISPGTAVLQKKHGGTSYRRKINV